MTGGRGVGAVGICTPLRLQSPSVSTRTTLAERSRGCKRSLIVGVDLDSFVGRAQMEIGASARRMASVDDSCMLTVGIKLL